MSVRVLSNISCPTCQSSHVIGAEYEGIVEQTILRLFRMFPLLCQACNMRFYMFLAKSSALYSERVYSWQIAKQGKSNPPSS
jgi:hypothetical protein